MSLRFCLAALFACVLLVSSAEVIGQSCPVSAARIPVSLQATETCFPVVELPPFAAQPPAADTLEGFGTALHGSVSAGLPGELCYTPDDDDFWSLRSDSFTYSYSHTSVPGTVLTGLVQLVADPSATISLRDTFDDTLTTCGWTPTQPPGQWLDVVEDPVGSGRHWLRIWESAPGPAFLSLEAEPMLNESWGWGSCQVAPPAGDGGVKTGTVDDCFCMRLDTEDVDAALEATLMRAEFGDGSGGTVPPVEIQLLREGEPSQVRARSVDSDFDCVTPWFPLGSEHSLLQLDVLRAEAGAPAAGMMLRVDGRTAGLMRCLPPELEGLQAVHLGLVDLTSTAGPRLGFDGIEILDRQDVGSTWVPPVRRIDTFECGTGSWSSDGSWPPQATAAAALTGDQGLEVDLGAIASSSPAYGFLHDDEPEGQTAFNLRFRLDPHTADLVNGNSAILAGASKSNGMHGGEHLRLKLRGLGGVLELRAEAKNDEGQYETTVWTPLATGAHPVEVQWKAAGGDGAGDGFVRLWVDGTLRGEVVGIDNDSWDVESFRLGGIWLPASALGVVYIDDVETWE